MRLVAIPIMDSYPHVRCVDVKASFVAREMPVVQ
jgi:hypothetical protein